MPEYYLVTLFLWFSTTAHCLEAQNWVSCTVNWIGFLYAASFCTACGCTVLYISHRPQLCCTVCWMILATQKGMAPNQYLCSLQMFRPLWRPLLSWSTAPMLQTLESHFFQRTSTLPTSSLMSSHCEAHFSTLLWSVHVAITTQYYVQSGYCMLCVSICICLYVYCACTSMYRCIWSNLCTCVHVSIACENALLYLLTLYLHPTQLAWFMVRFEDFSFVTHNSVHYVILCYIHCISFTCYVLMQVCKCHWPVCHWTVCWRGMVNKVWLVLRISFSDVDREISLD